MSKHSRRATSPTYILRDVYEDVPTSGYIESRTNDRGEEFGRIFGYRMGYGAEVNPDAIATQVIEVEESELARHAFDVVSAPRGVVVFSGSLEGARAKLIELGADPSALPGMEVSKTGEFVIVTTSGHGATSRVNGESSLALAYGREATATADGPSSQAIATGEASQAVSSGCGSRAISTGEIGRSRSDGNSSQAVANGKRGVATNAGHGGQAVSTGARGRAVAAGKYGVAVSTGYGGHAIATADHGVAVACNEWACVAANGSNSVAISVSPDGMVGGAMGTLLVAIYRDQDGIPHVAHARVGEDGIREHTWYRVASDGRLVALDRPMSADEVAALGGGNE